MIELLFHLCATIPHALCTTSLAVEDVGSTVDTIQFTDRYRFSPSPSDGRTDGEKRPCERDGGRTAAFPVFAYFLPFLCWLPVRRPPISHSSLLSLPQSPLLPTSDAISTIVYRDPFRRSAAKRNSPRASEVMSPSPPPSTEVATAAANLRSYD